MMKIVDLSVIFYSLYDPYILFDSKKCTPLCDISFQPLEKFAHLYQQGNYGLCVHRMTQTCFAIVKRKYSNLFDDIQC